MSKLSARQNIVVTADETHRSQYGFGGKMNEKTGEMVEAHRQLEAAAGSGKPVQGCDEPLQDRDRARHVADRL